MPSKMATSLFPSFKGVPSWSLRICRANSNLGTRMVSPLESLVKWVCSRSMSMHKGDSKSTRPSAVRGQVFRSRVLK